jgi:uncharacterized repeat protein (TIGR03803 family)
MKSEKISFMMIAVLGVFGVSLLLGVHASAQTEVILHHFGGSKWDGTYPSSGVIFDAAGNLYGETGSGGSRENGGTVYELSPRAGGGWMEQVLHNFDGNGGGGDEPNSGLIFDAAGNLYGTTGQRSYNFGKAFELSPKPSGGWMETLLYNFSFSNASFPAGVVFDTAGNLYGPAGVTRYGAGAIFELAPNAGGGWTQSVIHNFDRIFTYPNAGMIFDAAGHLYGTARGGGVHGHGAGMVFELGRDADGQWTDFSVLHNFNNNGTDGANPGGGIIFDSSAHLYGTTDKGGTGAGGTVYELAPIGGGKWTEKILYNFSVKDEATDGVYPNSTLVVDSGGNLYGTASGGAYNGGVVFELSPAADGGWTETVLHSFANNRNDGIGPMGPLVLDAAGNIYGTTFGGGRYESGVVFEIVR